MTTRAVAETVTAKRRPELWYRDPLSCLQSTLAAVVLDAGADPLEVLGLSFEFLYKPGDVRPEEFYFPCRFHDDLARSLAPYSPLRSQWWQPSEDRDPLDELAERIDAGELPIAAVDNYHLPFRPAFHDVHAAHLVVVYAIDRSAGEVFVSDAQPPAFQGAIAADAFLQSWSSVNPPDVQDAFFAGARIDRRALSVRVEEPFEPLDRERLRAALLANADRFAADDDVGWNGVHGLERYVDDLVAGARTGERRPLEEVYPLGWGLQAQAYLHGELLRVGGLGWSLPELREAGRGAACVASAWTALRIAAAHGLAGPAEAAPDLRRHGDRLRRSYEEALERLDRAVTAL